MLKKKYLFLILGIFLVSSSQSFGQESPVVIELFTSQGCSSCPPADRLISSIEREYGDKAIILSYHVDYWNYIGWEDPFSAKRFTQKQYDFAKSNHSSNVYTPQAVINQKIHFTGSNSQKMKSALRLSPKNLLNTSITLADAQREESKVTLQLSYKHLPKDAQITYAITVAEKTTKVARGENRNRELTNTNIVADVITTKSPQPSKNIELKIPSWVQANDSLKVIVYVQTPNEGITYALQETI